MNTPVLMVDHLRVEYGPVTAVQDVSFSLYAGETLGIVGESGCGKTTLALALMNLLPAGESRLSAGRIVLNNRDMTSLPETSWREIRGKKMAMIFQDPFSSLNPVMTINSQMQECIRLDQGEDDMEKARALLRQVQLLDEDRILASYPHQLSGGQRQRVMLAMALSQTPDILIADEPTTALDVTVQADIMALLQKLQKELKLAMIFITHNLGLVKIIANRVMVMKGGVVVEAGLTSAVLKEPQHAYTKELLDSVPRLKALCR